MATEILFARGDAEAQRKENAVQENCDRFRKKSLPNSNADLPSAAPVIPAKAGIRLVSASLRPCGKTYLLPREGESTN